MAEDNDDNILIDSDEEQTPQKRKSKASDFIPKPRLNLPTQVTKLVTGASSPNDSPRLVLQDDSLTAPAVIPERRHSHLSYGAPDTGEVTIVQTGISSSLPKSVTLNNGDESPRHEPSSENSASPSSVQLVDRQNINSKDEKSVESTYKRLISERSAEDQLDEIDYDQSKHKGLCRVLKHPTIRRNWKVYLGSFALMILGLASFMFGLAVGSYEMSQGRAFHDDLKSVIFLIGGIILLIPGGYHFLYMTLAACQVRGFKFSKLPTLRIDTWS